MKLRDELDEIFRSGPLVFTVLGAAAAMVIASLAALVSLAARTFP